MLERLDIKSTDKILDVGCGKGSALKTISKFPFGLVAGIELSEVIASIARNNFRKTTYNQIEIFTGDILDFDFLSNFNIFYLYNPFSREILQKFISKLYMVGYGHTIIYNNPIDPELMLAHGYTEKLRCQNTWGSPIIVYEYKTTRETSQI